MQAVVGGRLPAARYRASAVHTKPIPLRSERPAAAEVECRAFGASLAFQPWALRCSRLTSSSDAGAGPPRLAESVDRAGLAPPVPPGGGVQLRGVTAFCMARTDGSGSDRGPCS